MCPWLQPPSTKNNKIEKCWHLIHEVHEALLHTLEGGFVLVLFQNVYRLAAILPSDSSINPRHLYSFFFSSLYFIFIHLLTPFKDHAILFPITHLQLLKIDKHNFFLRSIRFFLLCCSTLSFLFQYEGLF